MPIVEINTQTNNDFYSKWYKPHTPWPNLNGRKWGRLNSKYSFDLARMLAETDKIENEHGYQPFPIDDGKWRWTYRGIGLTARKGAKDPLYDSLRIYSNNGELNISNTFKAMAKEKEYPIAPELYEKNFSEKTTIYRDYLGEVLDRFQLPKCKVRLLNLKPRGVITPHVDFPYYQQIRIHTVLKTNPHVWWECEGEKFQIPADGNWYWFDTGKCHAVWNDGITDRLVLSTNLSIYEDRDGRPVNLNRPFYEFLNSEDL